MLEGSSLFRRNALRSLLVLGSLQVGQEALLGCTILIVAILRFVHGKFEELFIVFTALPSIFFHFLFEASQIVGIVALRVGRGELKALFLGQFDDFRCHLARQLTALAEDHAPDAVVHHRIARLVH